MGTIGVESDGRIWYGSAGDGFEYGNWGQDYEFLSRERSKPIGYQVKRERCGDQIEFDRVKKHRKGAIEGKEKVMFRCNGGGGLRKKKNRSICFSEESESDSVASCSSSNHKKRAIVSKEKLVFRSISKGGLPKKKRSTCFSEEPESDSARNCGCEIHIPLEKLLVLKWSYIEIVNVLLNRIFCQLRHGDRPVRFVLKSFQVLERCITSLSISLPQIGSEPSNWYTKDWVRAVN